MNEKYNILLNTYTGGLFCFFEHKGEEFCADLSPMAYAIDYGTECMVFSAKDGKVENYTDLWCKRNIPITEGALVECIEEFKREN